MLLDGFRQDLRKSRKNVLKVGKSRNCWSKVGHFPKSRKNDSKVGKSRKSRTPLTACIQAQRAYAQVGSIIKCSSQVCVSDSSLSCPTHQSSLDCCRESTLTALTSLDSCCESTSRHESAYTAVKKSSHASKSSQFSLAYNLTAANKAGKFLWSYLLTNLVHHSSSNSIRPKLTKETRERILPGQGKRQDENWLRTALYMFSFCNFKGILTWLKIYFRHTPGSWSCSFWSCSCIASSFFRSSTSSSNSARCSAMRNL